MDTYRADAKSLAKQIAETKLKMSGIDRQIVPLESTLGVVSARLQEARIANADQPVSIRIVETAVQPQSPLPAGRGMSIPLAAILGLSLGIVLALFVHYLQNPQPVPEKSTT